MEESHWLLPPRHNGGVIPPAGPQGALRRAAPRYRDRDPLQTLLAPPLQVVPQVTRASDRLSSITTEN